VLPSTAILRSAARLALALTIAGCAHGGAAHRAQGAPPAGIEAAPEPDPPGDAPAPAPDAPAPDAPAPEATPEPPIAPDTTVGQSGPAADPRLDAVAAAYVGALARMDGESLAVLFAPGRHPENDPRRMHELAVHMILAIGPIVSHRRVEAGGRTGRYRVVAQRAELDLLLFIDEQGRIERSVIRRAPAPPHEEPSSSP
jgi:hypothetical protein